MEIVMEILLEGYMELMLLIVPTKSKSKGMKFLASILAVTMLFGCMALFLFGACLIASEQTGWGTLCILLSILVSFVQIIIGFILWKKRNQTNQTKGRKPL